MLEMWSFFGKDQLFIQVKTHVLGLFELFQIQKICVVEKKNIMNNSATNRTVIIVQKIF